MAPSMKTRSVTRSQSAATAKKSMKTRSFTRSQSAAAPNMPFMQMEEPEDPKINTAEGAPAKPSHPKRYKRQADADYIPGVSAKRIKITPSLWKTSAHLQSLHHSIADKGVTLPSGDMAYASKTYVLKHGQNPPPVINKAPDQALIVDTWGEGLDGHLGVGHGKPEDGYQKPYPDFELCCHNPAQVAFGRDHAVVLTADGDIMTYGTNEYGTLGRRTHAGLEGDDELDPADSESLYRVIPKSDFPATRPITFAAVAATEFASYALTDDGFVFGWGMHRGDDGVLQVTPTRQIQPQPALLPALTKITQLAAGDNHVLALDQDGNVHAWGTGERGQLGRRLAQRRLISGLRQARCLTGKRVARVFAGGDTSFAITEGGDVYAWGCNKFGQCGLPGRYEPDIAAPTFSQALTDAKIHTIGVGMNHGIGITAAGAVLAWGRCDMMQLGISSDLLHGGRKRGEFHSEDMILNDREKLHAVRRPIAVSGIVGATAVSVGDDYAFAIDGEGRVWGWGAGFGAAHGQGHERNAAPRVLDTGGHAMSWVAGRVNFGACGRVRPEP